MAIKNKKIGDLLLDAGFITDEQLKQALEIQKKTDEKLGEVLISAGFVKESQIIEALEFQLGIPQMNLEKYSIDQDVPRFISGTLAKRYGMIPIRKIGKKLIVAMSDPLNIYAMDDIQITTGFTVDPVIATKAQIQKAIDEYYGTQEAERAIEDYQTQRDLEQLEELSEEIPEDVNNAPIVRLVDSIISQAVKAQVSDIHIEPFEQVVRVRFRIDGELQVVMTPSKSTHSAITTRIKIMGRMDIAEKRIPQDGRIETRVDGREIDMRISVLPTVHGEKIVIRLLDRSHYRVSKEQLGFIQQNLDIFDKIIQSPNGMILVTGPTGSGKSTTLYAMLNELNQLNKNSITIEDPVEYRVDGINQVQVNTKTGMTFASGLRSILRQDPDIIMIGEIRDGETGQIAVKAAITGHLVLSTLHTNDTASTVTRLVNMGIENYLVATSIVGVISQRLIKKICPNCRAEYIPTEVDQKLLRLKEGAPLYHGKGCSACHHTGYSGRTAIHEIMAVNRKIRTLITEGASADRIKDAAVEQGMLSLFESCRELVIKGTTTVEELLRVTYSVDA